MKISDIIDAMRDEIVARNCFIVEINVSRDNDVEIVIESENAEVTLEDCTELSRIFEAKFDRSIEDYSLTVGSAGLDRPFKVPKQFKKAIGTAVEVSFKGGKKLIAELTDANENGIEIKYSCKETVEGKKKKEMVEHVERFPMDAVNSVRPHIEFE